LREFLQDPLAGVPVEGDLQGLLAVRDLRDDRLLRLLGEGRDAVHLRLDVGAGAREVGASIQLGRHYARVLGGRAEDAVDALDPLDAVLDATHDGLLDLLGGTAGVGHLNLHRVEAKLGKDLLDCGVGCRPTAQQ
jgi:hypothetical protein